jgi:hypothetical protein
VDGAAGQFFDGSNEARCVGQAGMMLEGGFVEPFGVDREDGRVAERFEETHGEAAGLGSRRGGDAQQRLAKSCFVARQRLEVSEKVEGQEAPLLS